MLLFFCQADVRISVTPERVECRGVLFLDPCMGSSHRGMLTGRMRHGFGQYFMGTGFSYMTASALYRMTRPPYIVGGVAMWWGYVKSMLSRQERLEDRHFRVFLRKYQWSCLLRGKMRATELINETSASHWQPVQNTNIVSWS